MVRMRFRVYEAHESGIDLVLTDLVMPEMGGHELVERLRAHDPGLRVLFMSGYTERAFTSNGAMPPGTASWKSRSRWRR